MLKNEERSLKIKVCLASTLAVAMTISCLNLKAFADQPLTQEQFVQKRDQYLRYQKYVQTHMQRLQQNADQQRQQELQALIQQQQQKKAAENAGSEPKPKSAVKHTPIAREDLLLVMPAKGAKIEDIKQSVENAQGEIVGGLGAGSLAVILVKAQPGMVVKLQRTLAQDTKNFKFVDFNRKGKARFIPTSEPTFSRAWHLGRMHVHQCWDLFPKYNHFPEPVAIFDTGVEGPESWVSGWGADCTVQQKSNKSLQFALIMGEDIDIEEREKDIISFGNAIKTLTYGIKDADGHGTWVASVINGSPYNGKAAAGVNPQVPIWSVKIAAGPPGMVSSDSYSLIKAMCVMYDCLNTRIINISFGPYEDPEKDRILHEFFKDWYYRKNGLIFIAAGNNNEKLSIGNPPYFLSVNALDQKDTMTLRGDTAVGNYIDFTAPGTAIQICNPDGTSGTVWGTSLATPIVAGVASLIWTINPKLKNTEVEKILRDSCDNSPKGGWNPNFGWGMPDAEKACKAAEATVK